jgi:hypothetical protein
MPSSAERILAQLDQAAADFVFPMLDNGYVHLVDTRLHAFADAERWALVLEVVGYSYRSTALDNALHIYGEPLARPPGTSNDDFLFPVDSDPADDASPTGVREGLTHLTVRGQQVALPARAEPWDLPALYRSLVPEHRDLLFATQEELRSRVPAGIPRLLQLEAWHHPDLAKGERPSQSETFVQLAQVIARRDPSLYRPTREPNTHWSNWPDGGSL